jgi:hypothetical protein
MVREFVSSPVFRAFVSALDHGVIGIRNGNILICALCDEFDFATLGLCFVKYAHVGMNELHVHR